MSNNDRKDTGQPGSRSASRDRLVIRTRGILPIQQLKKLREFGVLKSDPRYPIHDDQFQPNSMDLRLGEKAYRVRCSFLPENETVVSKMRRLSQHTIDLKKGAVLEQNCTYLIPLLEELHLPVNSQPDGPIITEEPLTAKANPKSSTGRLDIFTRLITDYSHRFEEIAQGYSGRLYLEVVPKSFPVRVQTGQRLNQLRIRHGQALLSDQDILHTHLQNPILFDENGSALPVDDLNVRDGLFMRVSLQGPEGAIVGYKAKKHRDLIDLQKTDHYEVREFWDPIYAQKDDYLILEPEAFYIFASKERCRIPRHLAAEMVPYDTGSGELRTHYAGFFDSGFGGSIEDGGARAVLEVRSHDVPFLVEDGQTFFRMVFEPNTLLPDYVYGEDLKSNYQGQALKLGKHFRDQSAVSR
ncbi:2'-deoxycytidine 5'-triphosphate deaminase [Natronogracilivirga saccharolytica]|uniref:2'-deoxycytidine 5'-triphosphate deaminase n=1 Tax=Natronogracilivirga saccharolytica TaxID=2812953 RepID=A0A8J7UVL0_9BACT|nr:2'-deoxycytidine 5'-triphosphate deaminase [Natronogracilivirga saccharolytica]MBP3192662.1 2'-deoxycytidine 5'-triphosphate deaminase [Natronogracilivirga saccharolytica]